MGIIKELAKTILIASAERKGFVDGKEGNPPPIQFCNPFPQNSELAIAYKKGRAQGEKAAVPGTLKNINKFLE